MIKTAARKDFVKHTLPVWIDLTPPEISYEIKQNSLESGRLIVTITDKLSGLDPDKTEITPVDNPISVGAPILQNESKPPVLKENTHKLFYDLLFPIFTPTEPQNFQTQSLTGFSIQMEAADPNSFVLASAKNRASLPIKKPLAPQSAKNLLDQTCSSDKQSYYAVGVFDADPNGPDLTMFIYSKDARFIQEADITSVTAKSGDFQPSNSLLFNYTLDNIHQMLDKKGNPSAIGKAAHNHYLKALQHAQNGKWNERQIELNRAWDVLHQYDSTPPTAPRIGFGEKDIEDLLEYYKNSAPNLHRMIKYGLLAQGKVPPHSWNNPNISNLPISERQYGSAYQFSVDLDKKLGQDNQGNPLSVYSKTSQDGLVELTININGEIIKLNLTKLDPYKQSVNWSVSCH